MGTGIMLISLAIGWLLNSEHKHLIWFPLIGLVAAIIIHRFGFLRIVDKNLERIRKIEGLYCAFGFMPWKSYILIAIMMTMGIIMKHSALPKEDLAILYLAIGAALSMSSFRYFRNIRKMDQQLST